MSKRLLMLIVGLTSAAAVSAADVTVERRPFGSGTPGQPGVEQATPWGGDLLHAPQYMPGHPTAATIYPRIVEVECQVAGSKLECAGYNWTPDMGRAEYLLVRPTIVKPATPAVIIKETAPAKIRE